MAFPAKEHIGSCISTADLHWVKLRPIWAHLWNCFTEQCQVSQNMNQGPFCILPVKGHGLKGTLLPVPFSLPKPSPCLNRSILHEKQSPNPEAFFHIVQPLTKDFTHALSKSFLPPIHSFCLPLPYLQGFSYCNATQYNITWKHRAAWACSVKILSFWETDPNAISRLSNWKHLFSRWHEDLPLRRIKGVKVSTEMPLILPK